MSNYDPLILRLEKGSSLTFAEGDQNLKVLYDMAKMAMTSGSAGTGGSGANGSSGTSGTSGISGSSGTSGLSGTSGTSGIGTNGADGVDGLDGTSGTSGINGLDGTSGTSGINGQTLSPKGVEASYVDMTTNHPTPDLLDTYILQDTSELWIYDPSSSAANVDGWVNMGEIQGPSGLDGADGTSGTSGISGVDGTSGTSGESGTSGTSGVDGLSLNFIGGWLDTDPYGTNDIVQYGNPYSVYIANEAVAIGEANPSVNSKWTLLVQSGTSGTSGSGGGGDISQKYFSTTSFIAPPTGQERIAATLLIPANSVQLNDISNMEAFYAKNRVDTIIDWMIYLTDDLTNDPYQHLLYSNSAAGESWSAVQRHFIFTEVGTYFLVPPDITQNNDIASVQVQEGDPINIDWTQDQWILVRFPDTNTELGGELHMTGISFDIGGGGISGSVGTSGTSGADGTSGTSGESGTSGTSGESGTSGTSGESGQGVATGGTSGQVLAKVDDTDWNTEWIDLQVVDKPVYPEIQTILSGNILSYRWGLPGWMPGSRNNTNNVLQKDTVYYTPIYLNKSTALQAFGAFTQNTSSTLTASWSMALYSASANGRPDQRLTQTNKQTTLPSVINSVQIAINDLTLSEGLYFIGFACWDTLAGNAGIMQGGTWTGNNWDTPTPLVQFSASPTSDPVYIKNLTATLTAAQVGQMVNTDGWPTTAHTITSITATTAPRVRLKTPV